MYVLVGFVRELLFTACKMVQSELTIDVARATGIHFIHEASKRDDDAFRGWRLGED